MKRVKFLPIALLIILMLLVAACSGAEQAAPPASDSSSDTESQEAAAPVEEPKEEAAKEEMADSTEGNKLAELPAPAAFESMCQPDDEGAVKPVGIVAKDEIRIAVLGLENNPFWIPVKEGTLTAADELAAYNVTVDWIVPGDTHTADDFSGGLEAAVVQEYDAIATIAGDAGLVTYINAAAEAGIPVATFNSETDAENDRVFFVGADLYLQGETAAEAMAEAIGGEGKVGIITGFFAVEAHELRRQGFVDKLTSDYPNIEVVAEVENNDQGDIAYTQTQDFMTANPDLAGVYVTAGGPFGAAAAVEDAGKAGEVNVVSFDFVDETMEYVQKGVIYATIGQNPFAQGHDPAIRLYNYLMAGDVPCGGRLVTEAAVVTKDNIGEYWTSEGGLQDTSEESSSGEMPTFASMCQPEDEGVVQPVDMQPENPLRIAVLGLENNPFWIPVKEGTLAAADELAAYNTTVDWIVPGDTHTADNFSGGIEAAVVQEYDAIATIAGDAGLVTYINAATEAGIPVATFNSETDAENSRLFFVGADLYLQGEAAAEAMAEAIGGEGKVGIITGFFAVEAHELRRQGFVDKLTAEYPNIEVVAEVENNDQGDIAYTQTQDFMTANPDLSGVYVTAGGPFGAAAAVEDAGKAGEVHVVSFDFVDETMEYVEKGVIYATIGQNPFAQGHDPAVRLFNYIVAGETPCGGRLVTEAAIVTKDNISDFWSSEGGLQDTSEEASMSGEMPAFDSMCQPEDEAVVKPVDVQPENPLRIAVLGLENNPFWIPVKQGTEAAAEELAAYNTTVDWIVPGDTHTADDFSGGLEAAVVQEYDAIATIAGDAGLVPYIDAATAAGIPVATFNSETDAENSRLFFVGADLYLQGETAADAMAEAIGGEGKVGIITGFFAVEAHELRRQGFVDKLTSDYPNIEIVAEVENNDQGDIAYTQTQDFMTANPDLSGVYVTAGGPFGAAAAVEDAGKAGEVQVISFDFVDETMEYVQKGVIYATIGQNPFAQGHDPAIRLFNYIVDGEVPCGARLVTDAAVVTQDNISEFWTP